MFLFFEDSILHLWSPLNSSRMFIFFAVGSAPKQCFLFTSYTTLVWPVYVKFQCGVKNVKQYYQGDQTTREGVFGYLCPLVPVSRSS